MACWTRRVRRTTFASPRNSSENGTVACFNNIKLKIFDELTGRCMFRYNSNAYIMLMYYHVVKNTRFVFTTFNVFALRLYNFIRCACDFVCFDLS